MGVTQRLGTIPLAIQTDSSNNVGIGGAANASFKLSVTGNTTITGNLGIGGGANEKLTITGPSGLAGMARWTDATTGSGFLGFTSGGTAYIHSNNNALAFGANGSNNFAATMTLTSGNVGIGTSSPQSLLDVRGATPFIRITDTSVTGETGLVMDAGGGLIRGGLTINYGTGEYKSYCGAAGNAYFQTFHTNGSERMRITSGGQLQIKQGANTFSDGLRLINSANAYWGLVSGGDTNLYLGYNSPTISVGVFNSSTGTYTATSDINKKKDFEQSTIGLDAVLGLKPTLYRMKTDSETTEKHLGFIAQEVKEFIPQAYSENTNGDSVFIGLTEMPIIAALVKAIQELNAKVTALENK